MANATARRFGWPDTLVAETGRWLVLARPQQPTLGAAVLVCREDVTAFGEVSPQAFAELQPIVARMERALRAFVAYDKINYLMLMMVDPDVHFHVIPRHGEPRQFGDQVFVDAGWPAAPVLAPAITLEGEALAALIVALREAWEAAAD